MKLWLIYVLITNKAAVTEVLNVCEHLVKLANDRVPTVVVEPDDTISIVVNGNA